MNKLYIGFDKTIEVPHGGLLYIDDEVTKIRRATIFDPARHSFNPLKNIEARHARELAHVLYAISPQGQDTLTVRNGRRALAKALMSSGSLDKVKGDEEVMGFVDDILFSPVLKHVFCGGRKFSFAPESRIVARIDRRELGDFEALILGLSLMAHYKGQVVVPDFGFYGRDMHAALIREHRLIAGINTFDEIQSKTLRQNLLSIEDKKAKRALFSDAELLARYAGLRPDPLREANDFNLYIDAAMSDTGI